MADIADLAANATNSEEIDPENPGLMSAYIEYTGLPVDIKLGYDKLPYSQESMFGFQNMVYWQRTQINRGEFFSRRDAGVTLHKSLWEKKINLYGGIYTGMGENIIPLNANDPSGRPEYIGRVDFSYPAPYKYKEIDFTHVPIPMFRIGANARYTNKTQPAGKSIPEGVSGDYGMRAIDGKKTVYGFDGSFQYQGFSAQGECQYLLLKPANANDPLFYNTLPSQNKGKVKAGGYMVQASYYIKPVQSVLSVRYENYNLNDLVAGNSERLSAAYGYFFKNSGAAIKIQYFHILKEDQTIEPVKWTDQIRLGAFYYSKKQKTMKRKLLMLWSLAIMLVSLNQSFGQTITWPSAFDLSTANYSLTSFDSLTTAGQYPNSMQFYLLRDSVDPSNTDTIGQDYTSAYNLTSQTRINGRNTRGFSFINTGSSTSVSTYGYKLGAAVLAINTSNRDSVKVSWKGRTITSNNRNYVIRLYYRVGSTGAFTAVTDASNNTVQYLRSATSNDSLTLGPVSLPTGTWNQPLVQLEWKYFQSDTNTATGARAELAVDDIQVTSVGAPLPPAPSVYSNTDSVDAFYASVGQTSNIDSFKIAAANLTTTALLTAPAMFQLSTGSTYSNTLTITPTSGTIDTTTVYVRFAPTTAGTQAGNITIVSGAATTNVYVIGSAFESTNPAAVALATSSYNLSSWDSTATAGTYPSNTVFQVSDNVSPSLIYTPLPNNWKCGYNLTSRPRFNGLGSNGISIINTGTAQYDNCSDGTNTQNIFMGGIVAAVNTQNIDSASVSYDVELLARNTDTVAREYALVLQVRTDSNSLFTNVGSSTQFSSLGKVVGDQQHFSYNLPTTLLNQAYVEFRWLYYDLNIANASGTRPQMRLDNIIIKKSAANETGVHDLNSGNKKITIYPNPVTNGQSLNFSEAFSGNIYDISGRKVISFEKSKQININQLPAGTYIIKANDGTAAKFTVK